MKKLILLCCAILGLTVAFTACKSESTESPDLTKYVEQLTAKKTELQNLLTKSTYGDNEGEYPETSKSILSAAITAIDVVINDFNNGKGGKSECDKAIAAADKAISDFKATVNGKKDPGFEARPAELHVNGRKAYIDFGAHEEYGKFTDDGKNQAFTVECWIKLDELWNHCIGGMLSCFAEPKPEYRQGWFVNYYYDVDDAGAGLDTWRISVGCGSHMPEPYPDPNGDFKDAFKSTEVTGKWVHFAATVDSTDPMEMEENYTKIYKDGVLVADHTESGALYESPEEPATLVAFRRIWKNSNGETEHGFHSFGAIKHLHIWNKALDESEIFDIIEGNIEINANTPNLVCGWELDKTVEDEQNIPDITGKFSAKIVSENADDKGYEWK